LNEKCVYVTFLDKLSEMPHFVKLLYINCPKKTIKKPTIDHLSPEFSIGEFAFLKFLNFENSL